MYEENMRFWSPLPTLTLQSLISTLTNVGFSDPLCFQQIPSHLSPYNPQLKHHALCEASPNQERAVQGAPSPELSLYDLKA